MIINTTQVEKDFNKFMKENFTKEEIIFLKGVAVGTGVMTGVGVVKSIRNAIKRQKRFNEAMDNIEIIASVMVDRILEKHGVVYEQKSK